MIISMNNVQTAKYATLDELRKATAAGFALAPEVSLKYGLNVFFAPADVPLPFGEAAEVARSEIRVPDGVTTYSFAEALLKPELAKRILECLSAPDARAEKISAWHGSQAGLGSLIIVPPNFSSEEPVRIDLVFSDARRVENVIVIVGEGSRVTVVEHLRSADGSQFSAPDFKLRSSVTDVIVHPNAKATHISLQDFAENVTDLSLKRATVKRDASMSWIECVFGGGFSQSSAITELVEEGASVRAKTQFFGRGTQKFDLSQNVRHIASNTHSELRTRGALMDTAKTVYRGLVRVEKGTRGCVGHQKEDTLLLGEKAEIDAVPNLEIEAADVRCGHGASVGRLDKEKLFYLMSRGLDEAASRKFLVEGFFAPIVAEMRAGGLEDRVQCIIDERIAPL